LKSEEKTIVFAYLQMIKGARAGENFLLAPEKENLIGRGIDCQMVLTDPLCSRVHAVLFTDQDGWWLRDAGSRNGSYVNGQRADEARLLEGTSIRLGNSEFVFHESKQPPQDTSDASRTQTIVVDRPFVGEEQPSDSAVQPFSSREEVQALIAQHQLSLQLLGCTDPDEAVRLTLQMLMDGTKASLTAFLWLSDDGRLKTKQVLPEDAGDRSRINNTLTEMVSRKGRAVWVSNQSAAEGNQPLRHYADGICVPLVGGKKMLGALHVYLEEGRFETSDFNLVCKVSRILGIALTRARSQASLLVDHQRLVNKYGGFDELIGESKVMRDLKSKIQRIAQAAGCVLIRGESGSGKELVARAIHRSSPRADRPMLAVNCAAIPRELMESQLFGHKRGAFTGADSDHTGWFQQADSGTLFLDEVGELTLEGQAKLLRILEGHPFLPVGGIKEITVDVRVIAASNRDLREFVRESRFREDLYYRLSVFELAVPPLRDRDQDIQRLLEHFLEHFKQQHGRPALKLTDEARAKLLEYAWPGNVRQLRNVIDSAVVLAEGDTITADVLGLRAVPVGETLETLRLDEWEQRLIREALARTDNNVPEAARLLGIGRATLYRKIDGLKP
jgi:two-component system, NtrC family, response regulator HydG